MLKIVQSQYVVPVDNKKLIEAAIEGMMTSLDPHSNYLNADDFKDLQEKTEGTYGGLGLEVQSSEGAVKIVTPMDDTPGQRAGIQAGDYITALDGKSIIGLKLNDAVSKMKGVPGTSITLTIYREGKDDSFDVTVKREIITIHPVKARVEGDYGYVRLASFIQRNTAAETEKAIKDLQAQFKKAGKPMKGLILDMRNNPGGLLDQSVAVSDLFITGGEIVSQRGRRPEDIIRYQATKGDILDGLPLVVLENNGTASAAEIVTGALQDHKRATVVGLTSFGKGSVQSIFDLGDNRAIKLTTAKYYTPSGRSIQKTGIEPDLEVAQSKEQAQFIAKSAFQFSEAAYTNALDASEGKTRRTAHLVSEIPPEGFDIKTGDFELQRAKDVLSYGGDVAQAVAHPRGPKMTEADLGASPEGSKFSKAMKAKSEKSSGASSSSATSAQTPAPVAPPKK